MKEGLEECWSSEPIRLLLSRRQLSRKDSIVKPYTCEWRGPAGRFTNFRNEPRWTMEWALTPMRHCKPKEEYARVIAFTNHLEIICYVTGLPLTRLPKTTKSCSDLLYEAERSMYTLRALTGESRDTS